MMNSKKLDSSLLVKSLKLDTVLFLVKQYNVPIVLDSEKERFSKSLTQEKVKSIFLDKRKG